MEPLHFVVVHEHTTEGRKRLGVIFLNDAVCQLSCDHSLSGEQTRRIRIVAQTFVNSLGPHGGVDERWREPQHNIASTRLCSEALDTWRVPSFPLGLRAITKAMLHPPELDQALLLSSRPSGA